jgi:hypothetical protein
MLYGSDINVRSLNERSFPNLFGVSVFLTLVCDPGFPAHAILGNQASPDLYQQAGGLPGSHGPQ